MNLSVSTRQELSAAAPPSDQSTEAPSQGGEVREPARLMEPLPALDKPEPEILLGEECATMTKGVGTGTGFRGGYWPERIPVAVAKVIGGGVVVPPDVLATQGWVVEVPCATNPNWINVKAFREWMGPGYPDQGLFSMLEEGCATGYVGPRFAHQTNNFSSCFQHAKEITAKLNVEVELGRMVSAEEEGVVVITPLAMVPKPHSAKHRMIRALNLPEGGSINDGVDVLPELILPQLDDILALVLAWRAAGYTRIFIRRVDVDGAYRRIPVRTCDRWQLALLWMKALLMDAVLPMGLRSSCHLYQRVTLAIVWGLARRGISCAGYLDDKILIGPAACVDGWAETTRDSLDSISLNHSAKKWEEDGPGAEVAVVIGYLVNLQRNTVSVPADKVARLRTQLRRLVRNRTMRCGEVSQVVGWVNHLVRVVESMRAWCGGLYHQKGAFAHRLSPHWVTISPAAKESARRWLKWLSSGEAGGRLFSCWGCTRPSWTVYSDASEWGGAFWTPTEGVVWWRWEDVWPGYRAKDIHINVLEGVAMVTALWWWRREVEGRAVCMRADNTVALGVVRKGHSASNQLQAVALRWGEVVGCARRSALVTLEWVASHANLFADAFSRDPCGTSQVDREAAQWRSIGEAMMPVRQLHHLGETGTWWRSWMVRLSV